MSVIDIHPEELFDRLDSGTLTELEGERLRSHLASCEVCRFELSLRRDFRAELSALPPVGVSAPKAPAIAVKAPSAAAKGIRAGGPRRRRALIWAFAAAGLLMATGALASVATGLPPWRLLSALDDARPAPAAVAPGPSPASRKTARSPALVLPSPSSSAAPAPALDAAASAEDSAAPGNASSAETAAVHAARRSSAPDRHGVEKTASDAAMLFADANRARANGETARAVTLYRQLQARFPRSAEAELSQLTLATLLLHVGDARGALAGFDGYLARGARALQAEALVGRALSQRALGQREHEIAAWQTVAERLPGTSYARRAQERLSALGKR